ncbi:hypothetical protein EYA84_30450, partial [Verrucosispora sp. SN26_14.1]
MSTYRGSPGSGRPGRRSRWLLAGGLMAGTLVVGAAGVTAVASATESRTPAPSPGRAAAMYSDVPGVPDASPGANRQRPDQQGPDRQRPEWRHDGGDADELLATGGTPP